MIEVLGQLRECVTLLSETRRRQEAEFEEALEALQAAFNETMLYASHLERYSNPTPSDGLGFARHEQMQLQLDHSREPRSAEEEDKISRLWATAARRLRNIDEQLAVRCQMKSDYWTKPEAWTDGDLSEFCIALDEMSKEVYDLLLATRKRRRPRMFPKGPWRIGGQMNQPRQLPSEHEFDSTDS